MTLSAKMTMTNCSIFCTCGGEIKDVERGAPYRRLEISTVHGYRQVDDDLHKDYFQYYSNYTTKQ